MSVLDKVQTRPTHYRRPEDPHPVMMEHSVIDGVGEIYNGFTHEQSYVTQLRVSTQWYANDVQFSTRKALADKEILYTIYGPLIARLNELRARVYDRDFQEVLRVVDEIQKELVD